jgi:hypothetical protein
LRLLVSDLHANRQLALSMMLAGGVPLVALRAVRAMFANQQASQALAGMYAQLGQLLDAGMAGLPPDLTEYLQLWYKPNGERGPEKRRRMAWDQLETFERTVAAGIATWEEWADFWHIDPTLRSTSRLTGALLERNIHLDGRLLLADTDSGELLRKPWLPLLFAQNPDLEFQRDCFMLLGNGWKVLNLSGTGFAELPEWVGELDFTTVDIGGTHLRRLPIALLAKLEEVRGRRRQCLAIMNQAMLEGPPDSIFRLKGHMRLGRMRYESGQLEEAILLFENGASAEGLALNRHHLRDEDLEAYFGCAIETGRWELAVNVLKAMANLHFHNPNPALLWKGLKVWVGMILAAGVEQQFYAALNKLPLQKNSNPQEFFAFHQPYCWGHLFERLIYARGLGAGLKFLERAMACHPTMSLQMFRWNRILGHLKETRQWREILRLLLFIDGPDCHLLLGESYEGLNDPRCLKDSFLALQTLGEHALMVKYCAAMMRRYARLLRRGNRVDAWIRHAWRGRMHMMWRFLAQIPADGFPSCHALTPNKAPKPPNGN